MERLLTVAEMAERLSVKASWLYGKVACGGIPHVKVGRYVRFDAAEVLAWLREHGGQ
ncbi:MAG: helix-turn-helix domain-containing protein [Actinobacteria bacterium]|nr:MAG: helix-turn-helix domain-containing protein [Actinomycetota bacterium]